MSIRRTSVAVAALALTLAATGCSPSEVISRSPDPTDAANANGEIHEGRKHGDTAYNDVKIPEVKSKSIVKERVIDGERFHAFMDGEEVVVRLVGIDAPNQGTGKGDPECGVGDAAARLQRFLEENGGMTFIADENLPARDEQGVLQGYVAASGRDVGEAMLSAGYARAAKSANLPDPERWDAHVKAEAQAKKVGEGLWSRCYHNGARMLHPSGWR